jgi:hypothetical protein
VPSTKNKQRKDSHDSVTDCEKVQVTSLS